MQKLYVFNPSHDLALANGSASYMAPESARRFANDLAFLPAWYGHHGDVLVPRGFFFHAPLFLPNKYITIDRIAQKKYDLLIPWGWNEAICKQLIELNISENILYPKEQLEAIRNLAHRNLARKAMIFMHEQHPDRILPEPCQELESTEEVIEYVEKHPNAVLKAPWSGSGKGIFFTELPISNSLLGWCRRTIFKQGSVMGENALDKIQDFALEFYVDKNKVTFAGYSLFFSENSGIYRCNRLLSNEDIEKTLGQWVSIEELRSYQHDYEEFLSLHIQPYYQGYLGIDMFVYAVGNSYHINPAVEINLRMTMGMVSRKFYDQYVTPGHRGWYYVDHMPQGLLENHKHLLSEAPLIIENNKILSGYLSLCPIQYNTNYRARVMIESETP